MQLAPFKLFLVPRQRHATVGAAVGEWAAVSSAGVWWVEEVGKHQLMRRTGLTACDLRTLDPVLSYPSNIMGRDRAVITATEVLISGPRDPAFTSLVRKLRADLASAPSAAGLRMS
ncbi:putative magnesium transporter MRS2-D [Phragmites australis]|uniref:putative magnesium transporter MRS2-D n=1 Tax=Phragmites australis TaxID=29695 RepID=UPI002D799D7F|nr:putative magnesium transporter MRS2-D [Phragmites australis]